MICLSLNQEDGPAAPPRRRLVSPADRLRPWRVDAEGVRIMDDRTYRYRDCIDTPEAKAAFVNCRHAT